VTDDDNNTQELHFRVHFRDEKSQALGDGLKMNGTIVQTVELAQSMNGMDGLVLDIGFGASRVALAHAAMPSTVYVFDTFNGLETDYGKFPKNSFSNRGDVPASVRELQNVVLFIGHLDETLTKFLQHNPSPQAALVVIDLLTEALTERVLSLLVFNCVINSNTVLRFESFFNYDGWGVQRGEYSAWQKISEEYGIEFEYVSYFGTSLTLRIVSGSERCTLKET
jgi:hypothetical protein